jgi:hypothetical protein
MSLVKFTMRRCQKFASCFLLEFNTFCLSQQANWSDFIQTCTEIIQQDRRMKADENGV